MSSAVLDASALLALLKGEDGADEVARWLPDASISAVNFAEVVGKLADAGMQAEVIDEALGGLRLEVLPFDEEQAYKSGLLQPLTKAFGLSQGNRCCIALAQSLNVPALTADHTWTQVQTSVVVKLVR